MDNKGVKKSFSYFIVLPLEQQIREILETVDLLQSTQSQHISDITTGTRYKQSRARLNTNDITLSVNSDGIPIFKSSNFSVWPIFASINELPFSKRKKNTILHSLWFNTNKPAVDTFYKAFIDELVVLKEKGMMWSI